MADQENAPEEVGFVGGIVQEIITSPLNMILIAIITFLVYKIFFSKESPKASPPREPELPKLRRDFTVAELKAYDGNQPDGRVLVAVNGTVYDVTRGKRFYGPGELEQWVAAPGVPTDLLLTHSFFCGPPSCSWFLHPHVHFPLHNTGFTGPSSRQFTRRVVSLRLQLAEIPLVCVGLDGEYTFNELNCRTRLKDENRVSASQGWLQEPCFTIAA